MVVRRIFVGLTFALLSTFVIGDVFNIAFPAGVFRTQPATEGYINCGVISFAVDEINNNTSLLANHTLTFTLYDTNAELLPSLLAVTELWKNGSVVFLGPEDECVYSGRVAAAWNLPMLGWKCSDVEVSNKDNYPTLMRTDPPYTSGGKSLIALMLHFGWRKYTILTSDSTEFMKLADTITELGPRYNVTLLQRMSYTQSNVTSSSIMTLLMNTYRNTRVYIFLGSKADMQVMHEHMDTLGLHGTGEYLVLGMYPWTYEIETNRFTIYTTSFTERNYFMYNHTFRLVSSPPSNPSYSTWVNDASVRRYDPPFNFARPPPFLSHLQINVDRYGGYMYDAINLYARALDSLLASGGDATNGTALFERMSNITYTSITGAEIYMDENGEAEANWTAISVIPDNSSYARWNKSVLPIGRFFANGYNQLPTYLSLENKWDPDLVPIDEPPCGFDGEVCRPVPNNLPAIIGGVISGVVVVLLIVGGLVYRHYRFEQQLASLIWKIDMKDVEIRQNIGAISQLSLNRSASIRSDRSEGIAQKVQIFTQVGVYKGRVVALKHIHKRNVELTRSVRLELQHMRDLRHDNLCAFVGAVVDPPDVYVVMEYCAKGSLEDILENPDIKLDNMFKASLINDIIKGMIYIHDSDFKTHGSLKSSNCLVDSRWVLKITDYGLHEFKYKRVDDSSEIFTSLRKALQTQNQVGCTSDNLHHQLWRAPELLREPRSPIKGTQKADVYAFGIILHEIEGRMGVYGGSIHAPSDIVELVRECSDVPFRPDVGILETKDFILRLMIDCWDEEPESRPDFKTCRARLKPMQEGLKSNIFDNMMAIMERYANNLEEIVLERTQELASEKEKTDMLLHRMLPPFVANQLKMGIQVKPEWFDEVTIYFSDICGFTALSAKSTPMQIVQLLNDLYTVFDTAIAKYDVYKVETIGDAYMLVSGLPQRNGTAHAGEVASVSIDLLDKIRSFRIQHMPDEMLKLRIGIHSGACAAGVVGLAMPRYCLFGDTVNTASRMESNGEPLRIHVSPECQAILKGLGGYTMEERGLVAMKGKGEIFTYWLEGQDKEAREARYNALIRQRDSKTDRSREIPNASTTQNSTKRIQSARSPGSTPGLTPIASDSITVDDNSPSKKISTSETSGYLSRENSGSEDRGEILLNTDKTTLTISDRKSPNSNISPGLITIAPAQHVTNVHVENET